MDQKVPIEIDGFSRFEVTQQADGKRSFSGAVKIKGGIYFFSARELCLHNDSHIFSTCK